MNDNVVIFNGVTRLDQPAERVLQKAIDSEITDAVVIGWDKDGEMYFASSLADGGSVLWLMELTKKKLLEIGGS